MAARCAALQQLLFLRCASTRVALLLHGRVGSLDLSASDALQRNVSFSARMISLSAASHLAHITIPNAAAGIHVDVFVHSWNPEAAELLSISYDSWLRGQMHEAPLFHERTRRGRAVSEPIHKAQSQALSIGRAAALARSHERSQRFHYEAALVMRLDAVIGAPLHFRSLPGPALWFPQQCCPAAAKTMHEQAAVKRVCNSQNFKRRLLGHCHVDRISSTAAMTNSSINAGYYVLDWWFYVAGVLHSGAIGRQHPTEIAASWQTISDEWGSYVDTNRRLGIGRLCELGTPLCHTRVPQQRPSHSPLRLSVCFLIHRFALHVANPHTRSRTAHESGSIHVSRARAARSPCLLGTAPAVRCRRYLLCNSAGQSIWSVLGRPFWLMPAPDHARRNL